MPKRAPVRNIFRMSISAGSVLALAAAAAAHDGSSHANHAGTAKPAATEPALAAAANTPGFPTIKGGDYNLVDQFGAHRTSKDPDGRYQLLFFGYANCQAICSVVLPRMAEVTDRLEAKGEIVTPVMITVDPARDTAETLKAASKKHHKRLIGLTGSSAALEDAYRAFQVERKVVFTHPDYGDVYSHGSYIYLLAPDGSFRTLFPPVLSPERVAELVTDYIAGKR